ncbi:MAG: decaprenyl-phosphate phosphoribosyltransferase [Flavobacteriales bacterium]|nr:decaprenyl-phosphate phosphoribosyltransferase [Flavobacteriales bacterium]
MHRLPFLGLLRLLRVRQWTKNLFLFLPVFFAGKLFDTRIDVQVLLGFLAFCMAASAVYAWNDLRDAEQDKLHPEKKNRPIPAGQVQPAEALGLAGILGSLALFLAWKISETFLGLLGLYLVQNLLYSWRLKHIPIVDVSLVSLGFVLRILSGGVLADITVSNWIVLMTFLLALFLGFAKRRDDVMLSLDKKQPTRRVVDGYNLEFLNMSMVFSAGIVVVSYIMYCLSSEVVDHWQTDQLYLTVFPVLLGMLRYLQLTLVKNKTTDPTRVLLKDVFIQITIGLWVVMFYLIIYHKKFFQIS